MAHLPELRFGYAGSPSEVDTSNRAPLEKALYDPSGYAPGVPCTAFRNFRITPLTLQSNNVAALQTPAGAASITLTAGTGVTSGPITVGGVTVTALDITGGVFSRSLRIVGQGGVTQRNYTITGYDEYNQLTTCLIAGPNGAQTIETPKCWRYITAITVSGGTSAAISIGTGDTFGFPTAVFTFDQMVNLFWNGAGITSSTGFTAADVTVPQTNATNHVRGTYTIQSNPSNGTRVLQAYINMTTANSANMNTAYGLIPA